MTSNNPHRSKATHVIIAVGVVLVVAVALDTLYRKRAAT